MSKIYVNKRGFGIRGLYAVERTGIDQFVCHFTDGRPTEKANWFDSDLPHFENIDQVPSLDAAKQHWENLNAERTERGQDDDE